VTDITERKRAEEELHKAQVELAHVTRVTTMNVLSASIAHEVNQPLGAIVANADAALRWLARRPPELDQTRETLKRIMQDGQRAGSVIGRMRALLRKAETSKERLVLSDLVQDTVTLVHGELSRHRILLRTDVALTLPAVIGDRVQLQQVLLNLVLNGIDAMKDVAQRPRELLIRSQPDGNQAVVVSVQDTGGGLDPKDVERVFDAFYTTKPGGMGMGLAICQTIVAAHGGRLWASANEPFCTVFQFTLPVAQEETRPAARAA
jgi:C4-dicarboxylate-specific signal transduction histidine kinase